MKNSFYITAQAVGYTFPTGEILFNNISFTLNEGKYALVGPNGVGKTTLALIMAGQLEPSQGTVMRSHAVTYLPQADVRPPQTIAEYLSSVWESPFFDQRFYQQWIEPMDQAKDLLYLSGGEWMRLRIFKTICEHQGLLILDEPTNNLDSESKKIIYDYLQKIEIPLLMISHDRELLELADKTLELSNQGLSTYGGNFLFYSEQKRLERSRQENEADRLQREHKKQEQDLQRSLERQEKRQRHAKVRADREGVDRKMLAGLQEKAENTYVSIKKVEEKHLQKTQLKHQQKVTQLKRESQLKIDLPEIHLPNGKMIFEIVDFNFRIKGRTEKLWREPINLKMYGPQRWSISGINGSGKSTLLHLLTEHKEIFGERTGSLNLLKGPTAYIDQELSLLNFSQSALDNIQGGSSLDPVELRNRLAQFQLMKEKVLLPVSDLSGGEKLKVALAKVFLTLPAVQLLILDEPTNNLDLSSLEVLEHALKQYKGALLVVSHDSTFLKNIKVEQILNLSR